jgi:cytidine deaminase
MNTSPPVTTFAETAALWHVMNENRGEARRIAVELLPNERAEFVAQLEELISILGDPCPECRRLMPDSLMVTLNPMDPVLRRTICKECAGEPV